MIVSKWRKPIVGGSCAFPPEDDPSFETAHPVQPFPSARGLKAATERLGYQGGPLAEIAANLEHLIDAELRWIKGIVDAVRQPKGGARN